MLHRAGMMGRCEGAIYGCEMVGAAKRLRGSIGTLVAVVVSSLVGWLVNNYVGHYWPAILVGLAALIAAFFLLDWYIRVATRKEVAKRPVEDPKPVGPIPVAEGQSFIVPHGSSGTSFLLLAKDALVNATSASVAAVVTPIVAASGRDTPFAYGPSQSFANDVRRRLNETLGLSSPFLIDVQRQARENAEFMGQVRDAPTDSDPTPPE